MKKSICIAASLGISLPASGAILAGFHSFSSVSPTDPSITQAPDEGLLASSPGNFISYIAARDTDGANNGFYGPSILGFPTNEPIPVGDNGTARAQGTVVRLTNTNPVQPMNLQSFLFDLREAKTGNVDTPFSVEYAVSDLSGSGTFNGTASFTTGTVFSGFEVPLGSLPSIPAGEFIEFTFVAPLGTLSVDNLAVIGSPIPEPSGALAAGAICLSGLFFRRRERGVVTMPGNA